MQLSDDTFHVKDNHLWIQASDGTSQDTGISVYSSKMAALFSKTHGTTLKCTIKDKKYFIKVRDITAHPDLRPLQNAHQAYRTSRAPSLLSSKKWKVVESVKNVPQHIQDKIHGKKSSDWLIARKGYQNRAEALEYDKCADLVRYGAVSAATCVAAEQLDKDWIAPIGMKLVSPQSLALAELPGQIDARKHCFMDTKTGLKVMIAQNEKEVIIAFGPVVASKGEMSRTRHRLVVVEQLLRSAGNFFGFKTRIYDDALSLSKQLLEHPEFAGKKVVFTGQCLGGSIAQYMALNLDKQAIIFNSLPLGAGLQHSISEKQLEKAEDLVLHVSVKSDYVSDNRWGLNLVDNFLSLLGIRTPANFGRRFSIPTHFPKSMRRTHAYVFTSLVNHIKEIPDPSPRPSGMDPRDIHKSPIDVSSWLKKE